MLHHETRLVDLHHDALIDYQGAVWQFYLFGDGAIQVEDPGNLRGGAMLPANVTARLETAVAAIEVAIMAEDGAMLTARIADALDRGMVLSAPAGRNYDGNTHVTVGAHPDGRGGYCAVSDPHGRYLEGQQEVPYGVPTNDPTNEIGAVTMWRTEPDRSSFAAASMFIQATGRAMAAVALWERRREAEADAQAMTVMLDAQHQRLMSLLRLRAQQRCSGRALSHVTTDGAQVKAGCSACGAWVCLPLYGLPDKAERSDGYLRRLHYRIETIAWQCWRKQYLGAPLASGFAHAPVPHETPVSAAPATRPATAA